MDLGISEKLFVVTGATSGIGKSIAIALLNEGARVIVNARTESKLVEMQKHYPDNCEIVAGDITTDATLSKLMLHINDRQIYGIVVNASGPPAKSFIKTNLKDWDNAYEGLLRWKVKLTHELLPRFQSHKFGRMVFIESSSVKQPIDNLILSTSLRLAVVGFVKSLSSEVASQGITMNILAPAYHKTPRLESLIETSSERTGNSIETTKSQFTNEIPVGKLGDPKDLASLACWLLSEKSSFVTGQTISVDGGLIKGILG